MLRKSHITATTGTTATTAQISGAQGFTLIEVTIALAIMAFAITTTMALLPTGLNTFKESQERSVGSQAAQRIFNEKQQTAFSDLTAGFEYHYYTQEGELIKTDNLDGSTDTYMTNAKTVYMARVEVINNIALPNASTANTNMVQILIDFMFNPNEDQERFDDPNDLNLRVHTFSTIIPKM